MRYQASGTNKLPKKKAGTFNFNFFETDDTSEFIEYVNTHAICPAVFSDGEYEGKKVKGYRLNDNITKILPILRIDVDKEGMDKKVEKRLKKAKVHYIKKPSTSNLKNGDSWKWHYIIPVENVADSIDGYKLQYRKFLTEVGIDTAWIDISLERPAQNMNPAGKEGVHLTNISRYKNIPTLPTVKVIKRAKISSLNKQKVNKAEKRKVKEKLESLDPNMSEANWHVVAQALHSWSDDVGFKLFNKWSKGSEEKYSERAVIAKWENLQRNDTGAVTLGTLFKMSRDGTVKEPDMFDNEQPLSDEQRAERKKKKKKKKEKEEKKAKKEKAKKLEGFDPYNVGGELTADKLEAMKNMRILYDNIVPEGQHTFVYGSAGAMKTTLMSWICLHILKKYPDKIVHNWSFDASRNHQASIFQYANDMEVDDRFKMYEQHTIDDYHEHYNMAIELEADLSKLIILIDTYKFVTADVNSKTANKKALHYIKQLTALGATVISLGHTNKDGLKNSGTAEVEQDSDNVLRINRAVDEFSKNVTLTIEAAGRTRFNCSPTSFKLAPEGSNYDYLYSALQTTQELEVAVDLTAQVSEETRDNKTEKIKELKDKKEVDAIANVIDELIKTNNKYLKPSQPILVKEMKERESMSKGRVDSLLREYNGKRWVYKDKMDKVRKKKVKHYKLVEHNNNE